MTEYQYLRALAVDRYFAQMDALIHPTHDLHKEMLIKGNYPLAVALEQLRSKALQQLLEQRLRAEDIIGWLEMDTKLREVGRNYPDLMLRS